MEKFNFEEYRQPWETGPHWELKREFMEKYQDDFSEARLLCLAQAYSNIELMNCSYPDEVMRQVFELSKPLKGCRRFREVKKNFPKVDTRELQPQRGKRILEDEEASKSFKFIKFQTAENKAANPSSSLGNEQLKVITDKASSEVVNSQNLESSFPYKSVDCDSTSGIDETCSESFILNLKQSPDFKLMSKINEGILKLKLFGKQAFEEIDAVIQMLDVENSIKYSFTNITVGSKSVCLCKFYVGNTLISSGRDNNERNAKAKASEYGLELLKNLNKLPDTLLPSNEHNFRKKLDKSQVCFLLSFVSKTGEIMQQSGKMHANQRLLRVADQLSCSSDLLFLHFGEDPTTALHSRVFYSYFIVKNILISRGKGSCKKKARSDAAECGIKCLNTFVNTINELKNKSSLASYLKDDNIDAHKTIDDITNFLNDGDFSNIEPITYKNSSKKSQAQLKREKIIKKHKETSNDVPQAVAMTNQFEDINNSIKKSSFVINRRLMQNTFAKRFALFDTNEIRSACANTESASLNYSAGICRKKLTIETVQTSAVNEPVAFRCHVLLDGEVIGTGCGVSRMEAKAIANHCTIEKLRKEVYTIKVKNELLDGFVVSRNQVINAEINKNAVPESNVGCKMMKMMGWSGGSIGKSGGITEPIVAGEHRFHQGLGFTNKNEGVQHFKQKIECLLRDYSQTFTTSDLIFSNDFTKEERKEIHRLAVKFNLSSTSRGKCDERRLYIKHKLSIIELLNEILKSGGKSSKYELVDNSL